MTPCTMANILEFPTREKQAFAFLQDQLSQLLRSKGADQTLIDFAIASLTDAYGELQKESDCHFKVRLPSQMTEHEASLLQEDIGAGIEQLRKEHHDLTLRLAARLMLTELRLFQRERED